MCIFYSCFRLVHFLQRKMQLWRTAARAGSSAARACLRQRNHATGHTAVAPTRVIVQGEPIPSVCSERVRSLWQRLVSHEVVQKHFTYKTIIAVRGRLFGGGETPTHRGILLCAFAAPKKTTMTEPRGACTESLRQGVFNIRGAFAWRLEKLCASDL